jgi:hypothetical protein
MKFIKINSEEDLVNLQGLDFLQIAVFFDNIFFLAIFAVKYYNGGMYYHQKQ